MNIVGRVLGSRYEVLEKIGEGGMAIVYKARCKLLNRYVAIKVLKEEYAKDENFVKRFRAEAQSAAALTHPNIVSVYDVGTEDDGNINYIVMELLETQTLKDYIEKNGALDSELTLKIAAQIASALDCAHKAHIIHRDIKPQNIALNNNMVAKVTDFGIAKITTTTSATITTMGNTVGSVHYFSPEHAKGGYTDEKSDLYSLGIVMYEMATGKIPFDGDTPIAVALKQIQEEPIEPIKLNSKITPALNNIILKAMQKSTVTRYQSANELLLDISEALVKPNALISIPKTSVEAGETQVIPVIKDSDLIEEVPNLRTRQANKMPLNAKDRLNNLESVSKKSEDYIQEDKENEDDDNDTKKSSKKNKVIIIIVVVIFLAIIGTFGFFGMKLWKKVHTNSSNVTEFVVPNLINKKYEDVKEEYAASNIDIIADKYEYSSEVEEGYIISQEQEEGTTIKTGKIYVVVSKGTKMVTVTDVEGKDLKVAKYELEDTLGFKVEVEEVVSEKVESGIVISQSVKAGEDAAQGSTIKLTVSKGDGKETVIMPTVVGKTEAAAKEELEKLNLTVEISYDEDKDKSNGVVLTQSYPKNQSLKEGDLVKLTVNKLIITKNVSIDLVELQGGTPIEDNQEFKVEVTASIDGGATNTIYQNVFTNQDKTASLTINGYETAILKIYYNGNLAKEEKINF
jgi:serine/threonine-protein kinase